MGTAAELLEVVTDQLRTTGEVPMLRVFADNGRARRFYDKHGWYPPERRVAAANRRIRSFSSTP